MSTETWLTHLYIWIRRSWAVNNLEYNGDPTAGVAPFYCDMTKWHVRNILKPETSYVLHNETQLVETLIR